MEGFFKSIDIPVSEYPSDFMPKDSKIIYGLDKGAGDTSCEVKGFCKDGVFHIQEVIDIE